MQFTLRVLVRMESIKYMFKFIKKTVVVVCDTVFVIRTIQVSASVYKPEPGQLIATQLPSIVNVCCS
jgi:hypothetical protein